MRRPLRVAAVALPAALAVIQLVPVDRSNPPVTGEVDAPQPVMEVLRRACYDCHSHETRWPWYAYVAPVSWLVAHDVEEARRHVDLSAWDAYPPLQRAEKSRRCWEEVREGEMPLPIYLAAHPDARLTDRDRETLRAWSAGRSGKDSER